MKSRTPARSLALQTLFEIDLVGHMPEDVLTHMLADSELDVELKEYSIQLVHHVWPLAARLDGFIAQHAPEWPLDQVAVIDRNILRIALWEITLSEETPVKVAINEAVELAKEFGSDSAARFVNGVLGALVERREEIRADLLSSGTQPASI